MCGCAGQYKKVDGEKRTTEITPPNIQYLSLIASVSSAAHPPTPLETFSDSLLTSRPMVSDLCKAKTASGPVIPVMRRIPFATAVSSMRQQACASRVFWRWVPPQNSTEWSIDNCELGSERREVTFR